LNQQLNRELADNKKKLATVEKALATQANNKSTGQASQAKLKDEIARLTSMLSAVEGDLKHTERDSKKQQIEIAELKSTIRDLTAQSKQSASALRKQESLAGRNADIASGAEQNNKQLQRELIAAKKALASTQAATASAEKDLQKQKVSNKAHDRSKQRLITEVERMRIDAKLAAAAQKPIEKDAAKLEQTMNKLEKEKKATAKLQQQADTLQKQLHDQAQTEQEYLNQIEHLELMLVSNRKDAGNNMMSRIKELESMLAAERRKASELHPVSIVETWRSKKASWELVSCFSKMCTCPFDTIVDYLTAGIVIELSCIGLISIYMHLE